MATVSNLILLLDTLNAAVVTQQRIAEIIQAATIEGRDVSKEELESVADENDALAQRIKAEL